MRFLFSKKKKKKNLKSDGHIETLGLSAMAALFDEGWGFSQIKVFRVYAEGAKFCWTMFWPFYKKKFNFFMQII